MAHLGHMYANGLGVPADNETAIEYFTDAGAESGHPSAIFGLGYMHLSGYGVEKDLKKAFQFFGAAAEQVLDLHLSSTLSSSMCVCVCVEGGRGGVAWPSCNSTASKAMSRISVQIPRLLPCC